jgi:hypothetical protein
VRHQRFATSKVLIGSAAITACGVMLLPLHPIEPLAIASMVISTIVGIVFSIMTLVTTFEEPSWGRRSKKNETFKNIMSRYLIVGALVAAGTITTSIMASVITPIWGVWLAGLTLLGIMFLGICSVRVASQAYWILLNPHTEENADYFKETKTFAFLMIIFSIQIAFMVTASALRLWGIAS